MMNSTTLKKIIVLTGLTVVATAVSQSEVHAYQFTFDAGSSDVSSGIFIYDVSLEADETLELGDALEISSLAGVFNVTTKADGPYEVSLSGNGFSDTSANLEVDNQNYALDTLDNVIIIESTVTTLGSIKYTADFSGTGGGSIINNTLGPSTAAVPFEFSPGLGIIISTSFLGIQFLRRRFT